MRRHLNLIVLCTLCAGCSTTSTLPQYRFDARWGQHADIAPETAAQMPAGIRRAMNYELHGRVTLTLHGAVGAAGGYDATWQAEFADDEPMDPAASDTPARMMQLARLKLPLELHIEDDAIARVRVTLRNAAELRPRLFAAARAALAGHPNHCDDESETTQCAFVKGDLDRIANGLLAPVLPLFNCSGSRLADAQVDAWSERRTAPEGGDFDVRFRIASRTLDTAAHVRRVRLEATPDADALRQRLAAIAGTDGTAQRELAALELHDTIDCAIDTRDGLPQRVSEAQRSSSTGFSVTRNIVFERR